MPQGEDPHGWESFELAEQSNLWQWKFSLGVSQIHESAGPRAQAAPSLVQGEVSVLFVLHRVCLGTVRAGLGLPVGDTEVSKQGNRAGGYLLTCHALLHVVCGHGKGALQELWPW